MSLKVFIILFPVSIALLAILYSRFSITKVANDRSENVHEWSSLDHKEASILHAWQDLIDLPRKRFRKLAVGTNSNLDLIVPALPLMKALNISPGKRTNHEVVDNLDELQETFAYFFSKGSAAERAFSDSKLFKTIVDACTSLPETKKFIGGNAALVANKALELFPDVKVQLIGPVGPTLSGLMPRALNIPKESHIPRDEVHIILEYKVGEQWGGAKTQVSNRFIFSNDESNSKMTKLEAFFKSLESFHPDVILMSGLHLLEMQPEWFYHKRLTVAARGVSQIPLNIPIHLELASMINKDFVGHLLYELLPGYHSLGLNEQELTFAAHVAKGPHKEYFNTHSGQPEIQVIGDMLLWLLKGFGHNKQRQNSRLCRVHFHSLTFHMTAVLSGSWKNVEAASAAAARIAGPQACDIDREDLNPSHVDLRIPEYFKLYTDDETKQFDAKKPVISVEKDGVTLVFTPVLVCKKVVKTVGLGDAISATGLMYSEFSDTFLL